MPETLARATQRDEALARSYPGYRRPRREFIVQPKESKYDRYLAYKELKLRDPEAAERIRPTWPNMSVDQIRKSSSLPL